MLRTDGYTGARPSTYPLPIHAAGRNPVMGHRLALSATTVEPQFHVLLLPFRQG